LSLEIRKEGNSSFLISSLWKQSNPIFGSILSFKAVIPLRSLLSMALSDKICCALQSVGSKTIACFRATFHQTRSRTEQSALCRVCREVLTAVGMVSATFRDISGQSALCRVCLEVLTAVGMVSASFRDISPCSPLECKGTSGS
jgi:hypothetical protein